MALTRRQILAAMALASSRAAAQAPAGGRPKARSGPAVCLYSRILSKVEYTDLPMVLGGLGFDGCDLAVEPGGSVLPADAGNFLMPALEAITGTGLDAAMITTPFTSQADPAAGEVLGLAGVIGVPFFRPGHWKFTGALAPLQRQIAGLAAMGRASKMAMGIQNTGDDQGGATIAKIDAAIRPLDPRWVGYDFDAASASAEEGPAGLDARFRLAQPRLKMVTVRDLHPAREGGGPTSWTPCPLGEGAVDWPDFFGMLAQAKFAGPISLRIDYQPADELPAIRRDLAFLRKQLAAAYGPA